jgi:MoxR-like ATPase
MSSQIDLLGQPHAVDVLHETRKFFDAAQELTPDQIEVLPPEVVTPEIDQSEQSVDGFIELSWDHLQLQRTLHLDFHHEVSGWDRAKLEAQAVPRLQVINDARNALGAASVLQEVSEQPAEAEPVNHNTTPIDIQNLSTPFLGKLIEPNWIKVIDSEDFEATLAAQPDHIKNNLEELREVDAKLRVLSQDDQLRTAAAEQGHAQSEIIKAATAWIKTDTRIDECSKKISALYQVAAASGRPLTKADQKHVARLEAMQVDLRARKGAEITTKEMVEPTAKQIERLERRKRRREFERGLVVTESMKQVITQVLPSLARGIPAQFVGETGGAKTALAEYISRVYMGKEPEFIRGHAEVNSYQLMGKTGLDHAKGEFSWEQVEEIFKDEGIDLEHLSPETRVQLKLAGMQIVALGNSATATEFLPGPAVRAMEQGVPLIIDEWNAIPPALLKSLNKILQLHPGDTLTVQEDSGRIVTVQPGFCILLTANEKSKRYKSVEDPSAEMQNRITASTYRIRYPDHDTANGQVPKENLMIAIAALTDEIGEFAVALPGDQLERFVKAAHVSQKLFSGSYTKDEGLLYLGTEKSSVDGEAGLDDTVLAPRTMVAILEEVRASYGSIKLETVLQRWLDGIKNKSDRKVIGTILSSKKLI